MGIFKGATPEFILPDKVTIADNMPTEIVEADPTRYYTPLWPIANSFTASGYDEYILDNKKNNQGKKRSNEQTENIYSAVNTLTKATRYQVDNMRKLLGNPMLYFIGNIEKITA